MDKNDIIVSIICLAYNHESYIRQCLEGFVMQKTNFAYEVIIHDDASTDNTASIIKEYELRYPHIIKPIYQKENQYSKGVKIGKTFLYPKAQGKYIAECEGDDYWIDPFKLQKQVDFLEQNPEYSYSCHRYNILEDTTGVSTLSPNKYFDNHESEPFFTFDKEYTFTQDWITKTLTAVYRKSSFLERDYKNYRYQRDVHLVYELLSKGKGVCHSFIGGVFRRNNNSTYNSLDTIKRRHLDYVIFKEFYEKTNDPILRQIMVKKHIELFKKHRIIIPKSMSEFTTLFKGYSIILKHKIKTKINYNKSHV